MSGHSKWSKIKHTKGVVDSKRGQLFSKLAKEITVACKHGGGDPGFNPRLRTILMKARAVNMPADNIDRAIKKGTGELPGITYEEATYEGYAHGGVALLVEVLTDSKNRTAAEIRAIFTKHGGHMAGANAVQHLFHRKGQILVAKEQILEDDLMALVLDAGAEDMIVHPDAYEITTEPHQFEEVHKALEGKGIKPQSAEVTQLPITPVPVPDEKSARAVLALIEALEENDDVQNVYSNYDIPDDVMERVTAAAA
ncbi:MAG TPA: YebC/PmpR family DNA-binding transcriptional regulator [Verrucomicrobiae bacterium]|nr:YebC/PmpR family DNA-binding transcriptional regulator [Verrucomicrobiae bacterium]